MQWTKTKCLFCHYFLSVTRALSRALQVIGLKLTVDSPKEIRPQKIRKRRTTCPVPRSTVVPNIRSTRLHTIDITPQNIHQWCVCRQASFGNMILCDNKTCLIKWFHMECLYMNAAPTGNWFCPNCDILNSPWTTIYGSNKKTTSYNLNKKKRKQLKCFHGIVISYRITEFFFFNFNLILWKKKSKHSYE